MVSGDIGCNVEHCSVESCRSSGPGPQDIIQQVFNKDRTGIPMAFYKTRLVEVP